MVTFLCRLPLAKSHMAHLVGKGVILHTLLKHVLQATSAKDHKDSRWVTPEPAPKSRLQPKTHWNCACPTETMVLRMIAWSSYSTFFFSFLFLASFFILFPVAKYKFTQKKKKNKTIHSSMQSLPCGILLEKMGVIWLVLWGCLHGEEFSCPQWRSWCTCLYCNTLLWFNLTLKGCVWEELYWSTSLFVGANWIWGI